MAIAVQSQHRQRKPRAPRRIISTDAIGFAYVHRR